MPILPLPNSRSARQADLSLATSGGVAPSGAVAHPFFFSGFVAQPAVVAQALLMLARVARTRFYVPPNTLAAVLRAADPVVTSTPEGLRFESFSVLRRVCAPGRGRGGAGRHARGAGRDQCGCESAAAPGTGGLRASEPLHLNVGSDALRVSTGAGEIVEEKVPLPTRWLKGFAETQMLSAGMACRHALTGGPAPVRAALPRSSSTKTVMWATQAARSLRLATQATPGAVCVAGPGGCACWSPCCVMPPRCAPMARRRRRRAAAGQRLGAGAARRAGHAGSEPGKGAGFSGEGAVLHLVAGGDANEDAAFVSTLLAFEPRIDIAQLAAGPCCPTRRSRPRWACWRLPARWGSIWRRARTSIARCRCRRAAGYVASPVGRGAQAGGRRRGAARRRGAVHGAIGAAALPDRAGRRARARPLHLPLARQVSRHARAVQAHAGGAHVS